MACPFTPSPHGLCFTPSAVWSYTDSNIQVPTISSLSDFCCWPNVGKVKLIANPTRASIERVFIVISMSQNGSRLGFFGCEPQLLSYRLPVKVYVLRADLIAFNLTEGS